MIIYHQTGKTKTKIEEESKLYKKNKVYFN